MNASFTAVHICGATGLNDYCINGYFIPMEEMCGGVRVFRQLEGDQWLVYYEGQWIIQSTSDKGTDSGYAFVDSPLISPQHCSAWRVDASDDDDEYETQQLTISSISQASL